MELKQSEVERITRERLINNLLHDMKEIIPYLEDDEVTDISIPCSGEVVVTRFGKGTEFTNVIISPYTSERIIKATAFIIGKNLETLSGFPVLEGIIPQYNARITGILPPVTMQPVVSIRKPPKKIYTLEDYVKNEQMEPEQYALVVDYIKKRKNLIISGSTGSGKTTFTNACIHKMTELTPDDNFYIVEDTPEIICDAKWQHSLWINQDDAEKAVKESLRFFPDRIIFGEVRDGGLLTELLKSWLTGHSGNITTIHANDGASTLLRIKSMLGDRAKDISDNLSNVIHLIVHLKRTDEGIKVDELYPVTEETDSFLAGLVQNNFA